jgi:ATP-dependent Lon protease
VGREWVEEVLGIHRYQPELAERRAAPGVATGLALTPSGGDLLIVEATQMPGKGEIRLTGNLRNVMREAATTAVSFVRSRAEQLHLDPEWLKNIDLHLHIPRAGISQDAAGAGVAMYVAVVTLLLGVPARADVAVAGEITLRGTILPINGVKAKVLAAHRAGISDLVLPERNANHLEEVPREILEDIRVHLVRRVEEVLPLVLSEVPDPPARAGSSVAPPGEARP